PLAWVKLFHPLDPWRRDILEPFASRWSSLMQSFVLSAVPRIEFGPGSLARISEAVSGLAGEGATVLLVADPALAGAGIIARTLDYLQHGGHPAGLFDGFAGEPKSSTIEAAAALARKGDARCIIGLGGGTTLDTAKIAAACAVSRAPAETYELCRTPLPSETLPVIAIPTTAGTGSEVTSTSVFTNTVGAKVWAWGAELKPHLALLDPELSLTVPPPVTAATGLDALVHAVEACTNRRRNDVTDLYCHRAISLITANLGRAIQDGADIEARGAMLLGSCFAGIGIENCGTALAHNISHALAALAPVPHGRATGLAMFATIDWVAASAPENFAKVAAAMGEREEAAAAVEAFKRLVRSTRIKISLEGDGLELNRPDKLAEKMAAPENAPMLNATVRPIGKDDLLGLAQRVYALR
ncbi:MAG: iron-containing alcohol dehydrogenase, partial [Aestuariivirgaceae bacterium]